MQICLFVEQTASILVSCNVMCRAAYASVEYESSEWSEHAEDCQFCDGEHNYLYSLYF